MRNHGPKCPHEPPPDNERCPECNEEVEEIPNGLRAEKRWECPRCGWEAEA